MGLLRKFLAWLSVLVICLFGLLFYLVRPFNPDNNRYLAWVISRVGRALLGMQCTVTGRENIPRDRPTVVIANHQHNDDLFMLGGLLPPRTVTVGKKALIWVPFFGQVFWLGGNVIIDRSRSNKAVAVMRATANAISKERKSLWVFPEGTRSRGRGLQAFKKGAFHTAVAAGAPITMVCVSQYQDKTIGWSGRREPVAIHVLPPVETAGLTADDIPRLIRECHDAMAATIDSISPAAR
ncbi:lysophospholipid acyltransferase family protein [Marinobacter confluentis]|uniref:1-acyl-sn-glycerol-3-phosphate acyltransferase n=1 Tax=Marinobacter confluentis TaxID=1697557 RepID=A0A4Z1C7R4_9GAMM|nr:1-acylglycerol-3-phosphate O-acyltransferase [Marinobacter confluentis]TGN38838.1 1-acylglycerol-3-phosphate O-acyltransferase [Marinobacter confluentis]